MGDGVTGTGGATFVGVDGCKAGWLAVELGDGGRCEIRVFGDFRRLVQYFSSAALILVDIPIGLRDSGPDERQCDREARRLIGPRSSSVFPVPVRQALREATFEEASRVNRAIRGKGLSKQTWAIAPRIAEVDRLLATIPSERERVREVHPELLFWALNGRQAMAHNKKKRRGHTERLRVLSRFEASVEGAYADALDRWPRKDVAPDDVLDALAAAATARLGYPDKLQTVPEHPPRDSHGLSMEMVFTPGAHEPTDPAPP